MTRKRRQHRAQSQTMIALAAVQERQTVHELAAEYEVHPTQISQWTRQLLEGLPDLCSSRRGQGAGDEEALPGQLYQEIGRLKMELAWLKKTTVVKLTREAPKAVLTQKDTPLNHDECASTSSSSRFVAGD